MAGKRFSAEQIIIKLREAEVGLAQGQTVGQVCKQIGVTEQTYYRWRKEYGGLRLNQAKRLKVLEKENARLKKLVADLSLDKQILTGISVLAIPRWSGYSDPRLGCKVFVFLSRSMLRSLPFGSLNAARSPRSSSLEGFSPTRLRVVPSSATQRLFSVAAVARYPPGTGSAQIRPSISANSLRLRCPSANSSQ